MTNTINNSLQVAYKQLAQNSDTAQLDAEILLAAVLQCSRSTLRAWPEKNLTEIQESLYKQLINRRVNGEPIAYILGHKEFWSMDLQVTPETLIPRADTECLVNCVLEKLNATVPSRVADLGTGAGAIALALAKERPHWDIIATDIQPQALAVAQHNSEVLQIKNIKFYQGNWCDALPADSCFDAIICNPPYIAENDPHLHQGDVRFEPKTALIAGVDGLRDIRLIIVQARNYLKSGGWLFLEHGYDQSQALVSLLQEAGYRNIIDIVDLSGQPRVIIGQFCK